MIFKKHELDVLEIFLSDRFSDSELRNLYEKSKFVDLSFSGGGYLLTVKNQNLSVERTVLTEKKVTGVAKGIESNFIVFVEDNELTIECYTYGTAIPDDYREWNIQISTGFN